MELMVWWVELRSWGQWPFGEGLTWWEPSRAELAALRTVKPVLSSPALGRRGSTSRLRVAGVFWQALPLEGVRSGRQMVTFILATSTRVLGGPERPSPALRVVVLMFPPKALALGAAPHALSVHSLLTYWSGEGTRKDRQGTRGLGKPLSQDRLLQSLLVCVDPGPLDRLNLCLLSSPKGEQGDLWGWVDTSTCELMFLASADSPRAAPARTQPSPPLSQTGIYCSALLEVRRVGDGYKEIRVWSLETCLECAPQVRTVLTWRDSNEQGKAGALISMLCCDTAEVGEIRCPFLHLFLKN